MLHFLEKLNSMFSELFTQNVNLKMEILSKLEAMCALKNIVIFPMKHI